MSRRRKQPSSTHAGAKDKPAPIDPAWRSPAAVTAFLITAAVALAADLVTKHYAFDSLRRDGDLHEQIQQIRTDHYASLTNRQMLQVLSRRGQLMPGVHITLSTNPGVVFGLPMPRWAVGCATVLTMALVVWFFASADRRAWPMHVAMALILAGALGNLYDRLFSEVVLPGFESIRYEVRDFIDCSEIHLPFGFRYKWIFNVADVWLVIGVVVLLAYWFLTRRTAAKRAAKKEANGDA